MIFAGLFLLPALEATALVVIFENRYEFHAKVLAFTSFLGASILAVIALGMDSLKAEDAKTDFLDEVTGTYLYYFRLAFYSDTKVSVSHLLPTQIGRQGRLSTGSTVVSFPKVFPGAMSKAELCREPVLSTRPF